MIDPWKPGDVYAMVEKRPWGNRFDIAIREATNRDYHAVAERLVMRVPKEGDEITPTFSIGYEAAQALMDDLWRVGLRPTEGSGSAGSLAATARHLQDMRTIAFNHLGLVVPK